MLKKLINTSLLFSTLYSVSACSEEVKTPSSLPSQSVEQVEPGSEDKSRSPLFNNDALMTKLRLILRGDIESIKPSPMPGLLEVISSSGISYVSEDGEFLIHGSLYGIGQGFQNHTENSLVELRLSGVKKFSDNMIVYPAKDEKYVVTVFTDITCGYCRKMHEQVDEYNDLGITVQYLAYPRYGIQDRSGNLTQSFTDLRSIWCNDNPEEALTNAKSGGSVEYKECDAPVEEQFYFGRVAGVEGTPALIFADGTIGSGYQPPEALLQTLQSKAK